LAATVETVGADVVTQVCFACCWLDGNAWHIQGIVRTVHAALGRRFFVLLNSHDGSLEACGGRAIENAASG
jgi:predicted Rdx family selenoprotein